MTRHLSWSRVGLVAPALALALVAGPAAPRAAQDQATADVVAGFDDMARRLTESMTRDLGLSPIQIPQVEKANLAAAATIRDAALQWEAGNQASTQNLLGQALRAFATRESDLKAVLTPDQQAIFKEQQTVRGAEMQSKLMTMTLKLDGPQAAKVSQINLDTARRMQTTLAPARNVAAPTSERFRALRAAETLQNEKDDALKAILDKDQWKTYKKQKEQMKELFRESWQRRGAP